MTNQNPSRRPSILILGRGYVGNHLAQHFPDARSTRTDTFELSRTSTWKENKSLFSSHEIIIWTFPAASTELEEKLALQFFDEFLSRSQVMIYGTTSAYQVKARHEWITEESELDFTQVRTRTEEALRLKGACILHLSGIFGPGRDPLNWYLKGLIRSGLSYLNLIHVNDIVKITESLMGRQEIQGQRFNLSNGKPKTHNQIVEELKQLQLLPPHFTLPQLETPLSKRVSADKMKKLLSLNDPDLINYP